MRSSRLLRASPACDENPPSPLSTSPSSDRASACLTIAALLDPSRLASSASCAAASSDSRTLNFLFIATPHGGSLAHRIHYGFSETSAVAAWRTNRKACARSRPRQRWPAEILWPPRCRPGFHARHALASVQSPHQEALETFGHERERLLQMNKLRNLLTFVRSCICDRSMLSPESSGQ
jgi:hypothetical protein